MVRDERMSCFFPKLLIFLTGKDLIPGNWLKSEQAGSPDILKLNCGNAG